MGACYSSDACDHVHDKEGSNEAGRAERRSGCRGGSGIHGLGLWQPRYEAIGYLGRLLVVEDGEIV